MLEILSFFSQNISNVLKQYLAGQPDDKIDTLEEIRLRSDNPIILRLNQIEEIFETIVRPQDILETLQILCENSIYSYQNQICNGYITVQGGHRIGITGNCVVEKNKVININYISSINFRIAKQIIGCSDKSLKYILNPKEDTIYNTLIISPPGARKDHATKRFNKKYKYWSSKI